MDLTRCPLSQIHSLDEEDLLPPDPAMVLGTVVHDVMHRLGGMSFGSRQEAEEAALKEFSDLVAEVEVRLSHRPHTRRLVPLEQAVGQMVWDQRLARLRKWAKDVKPTKGGTGKKNLPAARTAADFDNVQVVQTASIPIGREKTITVPTLRLIGRPDLIERDASSLVRVTDLKSGTVVDGKDRPIDSYALQLRLYGLILETIEPSVKLELWLEGAERVRVPWKTKDRENVQQLLDELEAWLPAGKSVSASTVAREGQHCQQCRARHRCPRYLEVAPSWWTSVASSKAVAPFDTWGTIVSVEAENNFSYEMHLRDAAGRLVKVRGVPPEIGVQDLAPGDPVWCFYLEPSVTLRQHSLRSHPQNFHIDRPPRAKGLDEALRVQVFSRNGE